MLRGGSVSNTSVALKAKIDEFVRQLAADIDERSKRKGRPASRRIAIGNVLRSFGLKRSRADALRTLGAALKANGIYTEFDIDHPSLSRQEKLRFARQPIIPKPLTFTREHDVRELMIKACIGSVRPFHRLTLYKQEYWLEGKRIDLLCQEPSSRGRKDLVVIELKRSKDRGVLEQIGEYMQLLSMDPIAKGRRIRGIVVSGAGERAPITFSGKVGGFRVEWWQYSWKLEQLVPSAERPRES
jgi:hypothetical protein